MDKRTEANIKLSLDVFASDVLNWSKQDHQDPETARKDFKTLIDKAQKDISDALDLEIVLEKRPLIKALEECRGEMANLIDIQKFDLPSLYSTRTIINAALKEE